MNKILTIIMLLASFTTYSSEALLEAPANKTSQYITKDPFPVAGLYGSLVIQKHENNTKTPTRFVIGLFEGAPKEHAFQVVLERIKDTDEYWLAYEYINDGKLQLRIDIQSGIKPGEEIPFNFFYHTGGRLQIATFETAHYPVTNMKSKTPFFEASSGSAKLKYEYREAYWKESAPPESK